MAETLRDKLKSAYGIDIEIFAKRCGIKRLYGGGRLGWLRKIPKELGFKAENVISKDL